MLKKYFSRRFGVIHRAIAFMLALSITIMGVNPVLAQLPLLPAINLETFQLDRNLDDVIISACVRLDGKCIFELSDRKSQLAKRISYAEDRFTDIQKTYLKQESDDLKTIHREDNNGETIYVILGDREFPFLTLTNSDVNIYSVSLGHHAQKLAYKVELGLRQNKEERQTPFLLQQAKIAVGVLLLTFLMNYLLWRKIQDSKPKAIDLDNNDYQESLAIDLEARKKINLQEVQYRLWQLLQITLWLGSGLLLLGLFPQTRWWQLWIVTLIRIPLRIAIVILACYLLIRLSYAAIARINSAINNNTFANSYVFHPDVSRRIQLRVNTFSRLFRGIVTFILAGIGLFVALAILGLNIAPLLAGAGVLGLAFSFASQNLIKDTINGLLIILEDQYAVGDVVTIGTVAGMVETLNLRITQLRDGEGRLITIPNSAIVQVANHSNGWSRSDLKIPFTYHTNADRAIEIVQQVATQMYEDCGCREKIIEPPLVLGVEEFGDRGYLVRLWFKTEPLKQWEVAREFRRRMQIAFEAADINLPLPHQEIWLNRH